jgi:UDP-N-acetyl-D-glucosamine/UDP-N-acetyl-D-galactosamine dehydrogenase
LGDIDVKLSNEKIVVVGLGYVGLPIAIALADKFESVVGFDTSERRVAALKAGSDWTNEITSSELASTTLKITNALSDLKDVSFFIVTVPTPIDKNNKPDLGPLESACQLIGSVLTANTVVVFESTVYPGVTEDVCGPLLEEVSSLQAGKSFHLGYSPERINPGDKQHTLSKITKIISAANEGILTRMRNVYGAIVEAGLYEAPSIKVAEAAKVLENTQRDINIALVNELAVILDRMNVRTSDVLAAAGTKWNFLNFSPGLVGGHCIGVDPYYLTSAAEALGYHPQVILAGRRLNDSMGHFIATKAIKLISKHCDIRSARVGILGLTFKENVPDLRGSKVVDVYTELLQYGISALVHDPLVTKEQAQREFSIPLCSLEDMANLDAVILCVKHNQFLEDLPKMFSLLKPSGAFIDVKSAIDQKALPDSMTYWSL